MMKKIAKFQNYFSRHLKLTAIFIAVLFLNNNLFSTEYIWSERANAADHGPYVWTSLETTNNESIWKEHVGTEWHYLASTPTMNADDTILFSSEVVTSVILTGNISVKDIICSYVVGGVTSRDLPITINLNGYQLNCINLVLGNSATLGANLIFIDEPVDGVTRGPLTHGVVNVTGSFDYADNANNTLSLNDNIVFNFSGAYNKAEDGSSGSLVLLGDGTASDSSLSDKIAAGPEASANAVWTGAAGTTDWATLGNWSGIANISQLENAKTVTIPAGATPYPEASAATPVTLNGKLIIGDDASVLFAGDSTLNEVAGAGGYLTTGADVSATFNETVNLKSITLGTGTTLDSKANLTVGTLIAPADTIIKFNQGAGNQTTTVTTFNFGGKEITFGNASGDAFNIGTGDLNISSATSATFGGSITAGNLIANRAMYITTETVINPQVTLTGNLTVTDNGSNTVMFQKGIAGTDYDFSSNANSTWFRGDVTVKSVNITKETQFLGSTNSITTTGTQTYGGNIVTNRNISLIAGENEVSISGDVNAWNSADGARSLIIGNASNATSLKINGAIGGGPGAKQMNNVTVYGNLTASGSMVLEGSVSVTGTTTFGGAAPLTINSKKAQTYTGAVSLNQNVTFLAGTNAVTFENTVDSSTAKNLICGNGTTATPVVFKGNVGSAASIGDLSFYGSATLTGSIEVNAANWINNKNTTVTSNNSTVNISGNISGNTNFKNLTITGTGTSNISGSNTVAGDFTCSAPGKTIAFESGKTQRINGKFTVTGAEGNKITLKSQTEGSTWTITTPVVTADVKYVDVQDSTSTNASIKTVFSKNLGNNTNWIFPGKYVWTGAVSTNWNDKDNWQIETDTDSWTAAYAYPGEIGNDDEVVIDPAKKTGADYPSFNLANIILSTLELKTNGELRMMGTGIIKLTATTTPLSNAGTIIFTDSGRITNNSATPAAIMDNTQGTVEYDGTGGTVTNYYTANDTADYYNLYIKSGNWNIASNIKAAGTFENAATLTMGTGAKIYSDFTNLAGGTVAGTTVTFGGACSTVEDKGTTWAPTAVFEGTGAIEFKSESAVTSYKFNTASKTTGSVTFSGKDSTNLMKISSFTDAAGSSESKFNNVSFTFPSATTLNGKIASGTTGNITFNDDNTTLGNTLTVSAGTLTFNGNITLNKGASIDSDGNTITIAAGKTVIAKDNFTITKGNLDLLGSISCDGGTATTTDDKSLTVQNVKVKDSAELKAKDITIGGTITPDTNGTRDISLTATNGSITIGSESNPNVIGIGTDALKFKNVSLNTVANDITFAGQSNIKATDTVTVTGNNITFSGAIIADKLVVNAKTSLTLQPGTPLPGDPAPTSTAPATSLRANSLVVNAVAGSTPAITYSGTIDLSGGTNDFVIDHAVKINGHTHFKVGGNFILDNTSTSTVGSLNPDTNGSYYVQITTGTGKTIQLNNNLAATGTRFSRVIFNKPVIFDKAHEIFAATTEIAAGCTSITVTDATTPHYTISGSLIVRAPVTFPSDAIFEVPGTFYNRSATSPVFPKDISVKGNFDDNGKWNAAQKIYLTGTNKEQKFITTDSAVAYDIIVQKGTGTNNAVNFTTGITVDKFDVTTNSYKGKIIFSGTADQTFKAENAYTYGDIIVNKAVFDSDGVRTGASTGVLTITNKTAPTTDAQGTLLTSKLDIQNGSVKFENMDVTATAKMDWTSPDTVYISGGKTGDPVTFKAPGLQTTGHIISEDDGVSYIYIDASAGGNITIGLDDRDASGHDPDTSNNADIGSFGNKYQSVVLNAGTVAGRTVHVSGQVWAQYYEIFCYKVSLSNEVHTWDLTIHATDISINGLTTNSLSINPLITDPANPSIALGGKIELQKADTDFIIDYPLQVLQGTFFEADNVTPVLNPPYNLVFDVNGNIIIKDNGSSKGSVTSNINDSKRKVQFNVATGKKLLIQNGTTANAGLGNITGRELGKISFNCNVDLTANTTVTSEIVSVENGITIAPETAGDDVTLTVKGENNVAADPVAGTLAEIKGFINEGTGTFNVNLTITSGDVNDLGTWNQTGKKLAFTGAAAQSFNGKAGTTYETVEINQANNTVATVELADATGFSITNLSVLKSKQVKVNVPLIVTNFTDKSDSNELKIEKDTIFTNIKNKKTDNTDETEELYTKLLSIDSGATFGIGGAGAYKNLTHTAGLTTVNGTLYGADIKLAAVSIAGKIETTGSQTFTNTITLTGDSELDGLQLNLPVNVNLDAAASTHKLTLTSGDVQGTSITFAPEVVVSAQDTIVTVTGTATFNKALSGNTGNDFKVDGNGTFSSTVNSFNDFAVTGNASFAGAFGTTAAINSLEVTGTTSITNASIETTATQTYSDNISITTNALLTASEVILNKADAVAPAPAVTQTVSGTKLTLATPKVTVSQKNNITAPVDLSQSVEIGGTKAITFGGATGTAGYDITVTGDVTFNGITVSSPVINNNTVTCTGNVTFADTYATVTGKTGTFNASAGTVTFNADVDFSRNTFVSNNGTIVLDPSGTNLTLGGSIATYNAVQIKGSVDIKDTNTFAILTASGLENKTITFPATAAKVQNVTTKLILTGVSDDDNKRLVLRSDLATHAAATDCFYVNFTGTVDDTNYSIKFVDMQNGYNARVDGSSNPEYLSVKDSKDSENNYYWNFPGAVFTWTGADTTDPNDWYTPANWYPKSLPGLGANVVISKEYTIGAGPAVTVSNFPSIDEAYITVGNASGLSGTITINDGAMIDFQNASVTAGTIINYGKVYSQGINTIVGTKVNSDAANNYYGTVIYYGEGIATASWGENYYNIWFGDTASTIAAHKLAAGTISTKLDVTGNTVIKNNSTATKTLTLSSATNNFAHGTTPVVNNPVEITSANENVVLNSNGTLIIKENASCNSLEVTGNVTLNGNVTTTVGQTYNNDVILAADVILTTGTGSAITFQKNAGKSGTGNSIYVLILDGNVIFGDDAKVNSKYVMPGLTKDSSWKLKIGATATKISIDTNIFCDFGPSSKTFTISDNLSCKNFVAYTGKISIAAGKTMETSAGCDFVAFGSSYSADDPRYSNADTRFAYYFGAEPDYVPAGATYTDADHLLTFAAVPSATLTAGTGSIIKTGRNFYVNGLNLSGFTLNLNTVTPATGNPTLNTTAKATATQWGTPYAVVFNSTIANVNANGNSNGTYLTAAVAQNNIDGTGNTNVQFEVPQIQKAYTVYDDVTYIAFNIPIENSNGDINAKLAAGTTLATGGMYYNNKTIRFAGAYADADCTTVLPNADITTADSDGYYGFYVKTTNEKWNTDADGKNKWNPNAETTGTTAQSTDRNGTHHSVTVDLSFLEGVLVAANGFTMSDNYGVGKQADATTDASVYDATEDKCAPVLLAVLTGKEKHVVPSGNAATPASEVQQTYDGHNFIEFRYSEPVDTGTLLAAAGAMNVGEIADLGTIQTMGTGINVTGLANLETGSVNAASKTGGTTAVHSLYRKFSNTEAGTATVQTHKVRLAIAGYVNGTISSNGKTYYNWTSYIESAKMPSGKVIRVDGGTVVKDKSGNPVTAVSTTNHPLAQLYVNKTASTDAGGNTVFTNIETDTLYNSWDVTPPSFAPLRYNGIDLWTNMQNPTAYTKYESVGAAYSGSSTLNAIEFHLFDNIPTYAAGEAEQWFTKIGWAKAVTAGSGKDLEVDGSALEAAADTRGGIRYSSIYNLTNKFTYLRSGEGAVRNFENTQNISGGAESTLFVAPTSANSTGAEDGCYIKIPLTTSSGHDPKSEFKIYFAGDDPDVFITDLAGNLLKKQYYTLNTVDRSSPSMNLTAAPCGKDEIYIVFSKAINIDKITGYKNQTDRTELTALQMIPSALKIVDNTGTETSLQIDSSVPAKVVHRSENSTGFILKLNGDITYDDIANGLYIEVKPDATYNYDPLAGITANVTLIQDMTGNYADAGKKHAFTDFAINVIEPEYAHNVDMLDSNGNELQWGLYSEGSWAVHSWGRDQGNYGTLNSDYDVFMNVQNPNDLSPTLFLSNNPDVNSTSYEYNRISGRNWRIWLPTISANIAPVANGNIFSPAGIVDATEHTIGYDIELITDAANYTGYEAGTTVTFLFDTGLKYWQDGTVATEQPLYALRLADPNDVSSLDLWSFKLKTISSQRGGVSILNNVINPLNGEKAIVRLDMPKAGNVNIMVMTLDGNIVTYLNRGEVEAGEQFFTWDGRNTSGTVIARGMYFIRIVGNGIDETRKVMIVK